MEKTDQQINDKIVFLVVYPIIALLTIHIGNDNTFRELLRIPSYYTDLLLAFTMVYLTGFYFKALFKKIDNRFNWTNKLRERIWYHAFYGILLPVTVIIVVEIVYLIFLLKIPLHESSVFYLELPVIATFCTLINLIYIILYFRIYTTGLTRPITDFQGKEISVSVKTNFVVNNGLKVLNIPAEDVSYFRVLDKSTLLVTKDGRQYLYNSSLENLIENIDRTKFFQLNRQVIAGRASIKAYSHTETRKLGITLQPEMKDEIFVSKNKASTFLQWLKHQ